METSLFDFALPERLIAQVPAARRDASRLLVYERASGKVGHHVFAELPDLLPPKTRAFRNNARVLKARLEGHRPSGGRVECLLLHPAKDGHGWWCLLKPGRKMKPGETFAREGAFTATVQERGTGGDEGTFRVDFALAGGHASVPEMAAVHGAMPLPPYIGREGNDARTEVDEERYQTVYADAGKTVAAAAPTAGLHFTPEVLAACEAAGHTFHDLTLHVGLGTFKPIESENVEEHAIHRELYELPAATAAEALRPPEGRLGPRLAVGTTSVRTLEDFHLRHRDRQNTGTLVEEASIYIVPPRTFGCVDILLTNFHLPRSTLLCLVSAFLAPGSTEGIMRLKELYAEAIANEYRFFSYGDAMLIL